METSLAERGAARGAAGTPGELLTRATERGLVRGTAAGRLTALFYEARFSSHPLGHRQRDAAEQALDELAADLAEARSRGAGEAEEPGSRGSRGAEEQPDERARGPAGRRGHGQPLARGGAGARHRGRLDHRGGGGRLPHGQLGRAVRGGHGRRGGRDGRAALPAARAGPGRGQEDQGEAAGPAAERLLPPALRGAQRDHQQGLLPRRAAAGARAPAGRPAGRTSRRAPVPGPGSGPAAAVPASARRRPVDRGSTRAPGRRPPRGTPPASGGSRGAPWRASSTDWRDSDEHRRDGGDVHGHPGRARARGGGPPPDAGARADRHPGRRPRPARGPARPGQDAHRAVLRAGARARVSPGSSSPRTCCPRT